MNINLYRNSNLTFRGYDALPIKSVYMQGLTQSHEKDIFKEMKSIAQKEKFDLFVNENNKNVSSEVKTKSKPDKLLSIWAQDNKAFVKNKNGKVILWNTKESIPDNIDVFSDYNILAEKYMPRGGDYFLGYKENGEKWLLINSMSIYDESSFKQFGDKPTLKHLCKLFDVKMENIFSINEFSKDLDEIIRPIGYPYILINDYALTLKNIEKMKEKFPDSTEIYQKLKEYSQEKLEFQNAMPFIKSCDDTAALLESYGFIPIKIGADYSEDINFINALAFKNKKGKISYITNSTKFSTPELEYFERLFEQDLRKNISDLDKLYFVSGGKNIDRVPEISVDGGFSIPGINKGFNSKNTIMNILAYRLGGIHCMCAEVPDFEKIDKEYTKED